MLQQLASLGYSSVVNRYCSQTSACPKEALQVGGFFCQVVGLVVFFFNSLVMFNILA